MKIGVLILALLLSTACGANAAGETAATADTKSDPRFSAPVMINSVDDLTRWMTYYYLHPQPDLLPAALIFADKEKLMDGDHLQTLQAFVARVFVANPARIPGWYQQLAPMSEQNRTKVLTAVWWSQTAEGKALLETIAKAVPEKSQAEFKKQIDAKPPQLDTMPIETPMVLDMLWAAYCATGDQKYVQRIISVLPWSEDKKDLNKMVLSSTAAWSLKSNALQHPSVLKFCKETMVTDAKAKPYLERIVQEVESPPPQKEASSK